MGTEKKILVVDDDPHINELVSALLSARGFGVMSAASGEDAVKMAKAKTPDLVVLDLLLPRMDGWEVCKILRSAGAKTGKVPILILSALSRFDSVVSDQELIRVSFFSKPFETSELVAEAERLLGVSPR